MITQEQLETLAALVNYYRYTSQEIDWEQVAIEYNEEFPEMGTAEGLRQDYEAEYSQDLDNLYIINSIVSIHLNRRRIEAVINWKGFPKDHTDNVDITTIDQSIINQYYENNKELVDELLMKCDKRQLRTLAGIAQGEMKSKLDVIIQKYEENEEAAIKAKRIVKISKYEETENINESSGVSKKRGRNSQIVKSPELAVPDLASETDTLQEADNPELAKCSELFVSDRTPGRYEVNLNDNGELEDTERETIVQIATIENLKQIKNHSNIEYNKLQPLARDGNVFVICYKGEVVGHSIQFEFDFSLKIVRELVFYAPGYSSSVGRFATSIFAVSQQNTRAISVLERKGLRFEGCIEIDNELVCLLGK